jgi:hypothetical protein
MIIYQTINAIDIVNPSETNNSSLDINTNTTKEAETCKNMITTVAITRICLRFLNILITIFSETMSATQANVLFISILIN